MPQGDNKKVVVVITGASSGIGRETARLFASEGNMVVLAARSKESLEKVAKSLRDTNGEAYVVPTDVSKEDQIKNLVKQAVDHFGRIDVWVNNAAVIAFGAFEDIPEQDFRQVIEVNLFGYIYGARAVLPQFRKQNYGTLINVSSVAGVVGQPFSVPYSISKFGIRGLGLSLDQELKNEKGINISTIMPSTVDTPIYSTGANYIGKKIAPPVSVIPAKEVAKAIFSISKKPKKNIFIGKQTALMRLGRFLFPTLFDKIVYWKTIVQEFTDEKVEKGPGNIYGPMPRENKISGGWINEKEKNNFLVNPFLVLKKLIRKG